MIMVHMLEWAGIDCVLPPPPEAPTEILDKILLCRLGSEFSMMEFPINLLANRQHGNK
jgi:hypothetical protein